jgi:hypothetical protein
MVTRTDLATITISQKMALPVLTITETFREPMPAE